MGIRIINIETPVVNKAPVVNRTANEVVNKSPRKQAYNPARRDYFRDYMRKRRAEKLSATP
jgi:hypothetical protein